MKTDCGISLVEEGALTAKPRAQGRWEGWEVVVMARIEWPLGCPDDGQMTREEHRVASPRKWRCWLSNAQRLGSCPEASPSS